MALNLDELQFVYSGGLTIASPTDPNANLGGARSTSGTNTVVSQIATGVQMAGTTVIDAYGNPEGNGSLSYTHNGGTGRTLGWRPAGEATYFGVVVDAGGQFLIGSSAGYLVVNVVAGSLPTGDIIDGITIANNQENVFPLVTAVDSLLGRVDYRCLYVYNSSGVDTASAVTLWIQSNTPAGDTIDIGLDPVGVNGTAATIVDGQTAPAGVTFSAPTTQGAGLIMGDILPGQHYAFWQRRTVPPETRGTVISNGAVLAISATV